MLHLLHFLGFLAVIWLCGFLVQYPYPERKPAVGWFLIAWVVWVVGLIFLSSHNFIPNPLFVILGPVAFLLGIFQPQIWKNQRDT